VQAVTPSTPAPARRLIDFAHPCRYYQNQLWRIAVVAGTSTPTPVFALYESAFRRAAAQRESAGHTERGEASNLGNPVVPLTDETFLARI
jgi:hypothetical protein